MDFISACDSFPLDCITTDFLIQIREYYTYTMYPIEWLSKCIHLLLNNYITYYSTIILFNYGITNNLMNIVYIISYNILLLTIINN